MAGTGIREDGMKREERVELRLRQMMESYGYRKYKMSKFEEYALYADNADFIKSRSVITFNDPDGHVMALKPDVTLSIVKNTHATLSSTEKLYYRESVFRLDRHSRTFREISQLGLECIGGLDLYARAEVLILAAGTLEEISADWLMSLCPMGFLTAMMDSLRVAPSQREELLECFRMRNRHELQDAARRLGLSSDAAGLLLQVMDLEGPVPETLNKAGSLNLPGGAAALAEIDALYRLLSLRGYGSRLRLDLSLVSDEGYYDGVVFQGFVERVPHPVLNGGAYGGLLRKFGHDLDAIGFAVCLDDLNLLYAGERQGGGDALVLYGEGAEPEGLLLAADTLRAEGLRVRTERGIPPGAVFDRVFRCGTDGLQEVTGDV